jgi:hypothetical protein
VLVLRPRRTPSGGNMSRRASLVSVASFTLAIFLSARLSAQGAEGGLISGEDWGILVSAPRGWVWDAQAYRPSGVEALFHKEGERYSVFDLHISVASREKTAGGPAFLAKYMDEEKAAVMAADPDLVFRELPAFSPGMDYRFAMREIDEPAKGYYQTLAYYEGGRAFFCFILSCRSPEERTNERGALVELLESFVYLSKE